MADSAESAAPPNPPAPNPSPTPTPTSAPPAVDGAVQKGVLAATAAAAVAFGMFWTPWITLADSQADSSTMDGFGRLHYTGGLSPALPGIGPWHVFALIFAALVVVVGLTGLLGQAVGAAKALPYVSALAAIFALVNGLVIKDKLTSQANEAAPGVPDPFSLGYGFYLCVVLLVIAAVAGAIAASRATVSQSQSQSRSQSSAPASPGPSL